MAVARDGQRFQDQSEETQAAFQATYGDQAEAQWIKEHNAAIANQPSGGGNGNGGGGGGNKPTPSSSGPSVDQNGNYDGRYGGLDKDGNIASGVFKGSSPQLVDIVLAMYQQSAGLNRQQVEGQLDIARKQLGLQGQSLDIQKTGQLLQFKLGSRGLDIQQQLGNRGLDLTASGQQIQQQLGNRGLDIQQFLGLGQLGVSNRGLDIQQLLGQQGLDTQRELGLGQLGLGQGQLNLATQLGQGNLQLGAGQLALQQQLGLGGLEQQKRALDLQYAQFQQIGVPQAALDQWKSEQEIALAKQAQTTNENRLALDTMQALANMGGPADYFQAADLAAGLKQRQAGGPVFLNRLLSGESGPAFNAPGGLPDVQSAQTLGAQMGQNIAQPNPATMAQTYNPLQGEFRAPPRPPAYSPPPSAPTPSPLPLPTFGDLQSPSPGPNYPGGMNPAPNPPRNITVAPNPNYAMPNPSTFNPGSWAPPPPPTTTGTATPPSQLPNPSTFNPSPTTSPTTNVPPSISTTGTLDDLRKRSKASKQQNKAQKVAA